MRATGLKGERGPLSLVNAFSEDGFRVQVAAEDVQNARRRLGRRVTVSPTSRKGSCGPKPVCLQKVVLTAVAPSHSQVLFDAALNVNRALHVQLAEVIPPMSVGESNEIITACPLSLKIALTMSGAGTNDKGDRSLIGQVDGANAGDDDGAVWAGAVLLTAIMSRTREYFPS